MQDRLNFSSNKLWWHPPWKLIRDPCPGSLWEASPIGTLCRAKFQTPRRKEGFSINHVCSNSLGTASCSVLGMVGIFPKSKSPKLQLQTEVGLSKDHTIWKPLNWISWYHWWKLVYFTEWTVSGFKRKVSKTSFILAHCLQARYKGTLQAKW